MIINLYFIIMGFVTSPLGIQTQGIYKMEFNDLIICYRKSEVFAERNSVCNVIEKLICDAPEPVTL